VTSALPAPPDAVRRPPGLWTASHLRAGSPCGLRCTAPRWPGPPGVVGLGPHPRSCPSGACAAAPGPPGDVREGPRRTAREPGVPHARAGTPPSTSSASWRLTPQARRSGGTRNTAVALLGWASSPERRRGRGLLRLLRRRCAAAVNPRGWLPKPPPSGSQSGRRQSCDGQPRSRHGGRMLYPTPRALAVCCIQQCRCALWGAAQPTALP
jgi:hypothetical protein